MLIDIETAPHIAAVWSLWDDHVTLDRLCKPGYTLCWAAKWHGEKEVMFSSILDGKARMISRIHKLLNEADAVCHYNGNKFDIPTLNAEFLKQELSPPAPAKQIDLLVTAKRRFRLASNKLDFVATTLGLGSKLKHKGFDLWTECMARKPAAFEQMEAYNKQDVLLLERVYDRLLPWIVDHPNLSILQDKTCCPKCASERSQRRGEAVNSIGRYARFQCLDCGSWFRMKKAFARVTAEARAIA